LRGECGVERPRVGKCGKSLKRGDKKKKNTFDKD